MSYSKRTKANTNPVLLNCEISEISKLVAVRISDILAIQSLAKKSRKQLLCGLETKRRTIYGERKQRRKGQQWARLQFLLHVIPICFFFEQIRLGFKAKHHEPGLREGGGKLYQFYFYLRQCTFTFPAFGCPSLERPTEVPPFVLKHKVWTSLHHFLFQKNNKVPLLKLNVTTIKVTQEEVCSERDKC